MYLINILKGRAKVRGGGGNGLQRLQTEKYIIYQYIIIHSKGYKMGYNKVTCNLYVVVTVGYRLIL